MMHALLLAAATTLAPLLGATSWANASGPPPTAGRVTIVDVFTFDCINCKHVTPALRALRTRYTSADLAVIGVHAPELPEERVHANVVRALADQDITWPVAYDDDFRLWKAFGVAAWPTQLVFDRRGRLRATFVGEGYDREIERTVAQLAAERT